MRMDYPRISPNPELKSKSESHTSQCQGCQRASTVPGSFSIKIFWLYLGGRFPIIRGKTASHVKRLRRRKDVGKLQRGH